MNAFHGLAGLAALLASPLCAQTVLNEHCGSISNTDNTGFSRQGGAGNTVAYQAILSRDDFRGWGFDDMQPGSHRIDGVNVTLADINAATIENVEIWVYPEDSSNPGRPDFNNPGGGFTFPLFGAGGVGQAQAFEFGLTFPTPVFVPDTGDVFLEVFLDGTAAPETFVALLSGETVSGRNFDIANDRATDTGHGLGTGGFTFLSDFGIGQAFFLQSQLVISPLVADQPGLALTARTNQTALPGSLNFPGTASFFSALHPCDVLDRLGGTRSDDVGWIWNDGRYTGGESVVIALGVTGFSAAPVAFDLFLPGSTGFTCLDSMAAWVQVATGTTDMEGFVDASLMIPSTARGTLAGLQFQYQGILLDTMTATVQASGCNRQQW